LTPQSKPAVPAQKVKRDRIRGEAAQDRGDTEEDEREKDAHGPERLVEFPNV
jgi:hypothetical protein